MLECFFVALSGLFSSTVHVGVFVCGTWAVCSVSQCMLECLFVALSSLFSSTVHTGVFVALRGLFCSTVHIGVFVCGTERSVQ